MKYLFLASIVLFGCVDAHPPSSTTIQNTTIETLKKNWKVPSRSECQAHGGVFIDDKNICEATYDDAIKICKSMDAIVPKISTYIHMAYECGLTQKGIENYKYRVPYNQCLNKLGIHHVKPSWSSTAARYNDSSRIFFSPVNANTHKVTYSCPKNYGHLVVCVKHNK